MSGPERRRMPREDRVALMVILAVIGVVFAIVALLVKGVLATVLGAAAFAEQGVGLQSALLWGVGTSFAITLVFAIVAGDGIVGELPAMLAGFLTMTVFFTATLLFIF
jgi:hypothetical protein